MKIGDRVDVHVREADPLTGGLILHRLDEVACDRQRDVGFQQCHADLAQRGLDVILG